MMINDAIIELLLDILMSEVDKIYPGITRPRIREISEFTGIIRNKRKILALYHIPHDTIYYSRVAWGMMDDTLLADTLIHEMAHHIEYALWKTAGHGARWRRIATLLGHSKPRAKVKVPYQVAYALLSSMTEGK